MRTTRTELFQLFTVMIISLGAVRGYGFEWPLKKAEPVATFGENRHGDFLKGIELTGTEDEVEPVEDGEIIFRNSTGGNLPHRLNSGLGNMVVLQHERGIRSVYGHLVAPVSRDMVFAKRGSSLGSLGSSGVVDGNFLYLQIIDTEVSRFVNPLLSLPSFRDTSEPVIRRVELDDGTEARMLSEGINIPRGRYSVRIETFDTSAGLPSFRPMAPYSVRLYVNGEERLGLSFESLGVEKGRAVPAGRTDLTFESVYSDKWVLVPGEIILQPGEVLMELVVSDFSGNETVRDTRMVVTP